MDELKKIIDMIEKNQSKERARYFIQIARVYIYETMKLLNNDRLQKTIKEDAINRITNYSNHLSPLTHINFKNSMRIC
ncbi:hypothetical protein A2229_03525 [Candidatus Peregrinibacteria bacterium RIFOXYA2_FULL_33_7]|nr:MAG: hypothetical protein A2229_03525 [Candidatus Peregrinibacteria bacterium RIFOXYA2_FULL_33_7]